MTKGEGYYEVIIEKEDHPVVYACDDSYGGFFCNLFLQI